MNELLEMKFEGMNILCKAIDHRRYKIIQDLALRTTKEQRQNLVQARFCGISAIHQAASIGDRKILKLLCEDYDADKHLLAE